MGLYRHAVSAVYPVRWLMSYRLSSEGAVLGHFDEVDGFFVGRSSPYRPFDEWEGEGPWERVVTLRGFTPAPGFDPASLLEEVRLEVLDSAGELMGGYLLWGVTLIEAAGDVTFSGIKSRFPAAGCRDIWDRWRTEPRDELGGWEALPLSRQSDWLDNVRVSAMTRPGFSRRPDSTDAVSIDGASISESTSFFLALGEAVNGPRGYFGGCLMALRECCHGGHGAPRGFRLVWRRASLSRARMVDLFDTASGPTTEFDILVSNLMTDGVDLLLE
ncbi:hypothetical protein LX16_4927 [Stackebrandtia albiflava]|uniref:Barstar (Barnase inhibitor) n=2 Tax=Stackebrandtia albiflava TaxID=406432 RepID=A0A562UQ62_9ACTN|nr:hypothetical protein LX16_4927 [Stackebrandtia albiflava]